MTPMFSPTWESRNLVSSLAFRQYPIGPRPTPDRRSANTRSALGQYLSPGRSRGNADAGQGLDPEPTASELPGQTERGQDGQHRLTDVRDNRPGRKLDLVVVGSQVLAVVEIEDIQECAQRAPAFHLSCR